jgi:hypothetical protein
MKLDEESTNGILKKYILGAISSKYTTKILEKGTMDIHMQDDGEEVMQVINRKNIDFLLLVTKLECLISFLETLEIDDNIVRHDDFTDASDKYIQTITLAIEKGMKELVHEK